MKKERMPGEYQVRTQDLDGISLESWSFEKCKYYCRKGTVVVSTYKKRFGISLTLLWHRWYKPFDFCKFSRRFNLLWLHVNWSWNYRNKVDKIVYEHPENEKL